MGHYGGDGKKKIIATALNIMVIAGYNNQKTIRWLLTL